MTALALRVLWISLTTSVVLLPLLICSGRLLRRYRAKSCALLWLFLTLRLLFPQIPLPQPPVRLEIPVSVMGTQHVTGGAAAGGILWEQLPQARPSAVHAMSGTELVTLVWLAGGAVTLASQLVLYRAARKRVMETALPAREEQLLAQSLGGSCPVFRAQVSTPMTLGLVRPVILLPMEIREGDLPMVLRHELCHIRRKDLWYKGLLLVCACVHWFNPLVWRLGRVAGDTLELCCDETVVAGQDADFRRRYGQVLLQSAAAGGSPCCAARFGSGDLKGRLMNLFVTKKRGAALVCAALCACVSLASLVGCEVSAAQVEPVLPDGSVPISLEMIADDSRDVVLPLEEKEEESWLWPVAGEHAISAAYGQRIHPITGAVSVHDGVDILAEQGTAVLCARSGRVVQADFEPEKGNYVLVAHENGYETVYAHLSKIQVQEGEQVVQGQILGKVGATGMATGAHLHFSVGDGQGSTCDPLDLYSGLTFQIQGVTKDLGLTD